VKNHFKKHQESVAEGLLDKSKGKVVDLFEQKLEDL
jgi:hypothetical protein